MMRDSAKHCHFSPNAWTVQWLVFRPKLGGVGQAMIEGDMNKDQEHKIYVRTIDTDTDIDIEDRYRNVHLYPKKKGFTWSTILARALIDTGNCLFGE